MFTCFSFSYENNKALFIASILHKLNISVIALQKSYLQETLSFQYTKVKFGKVPLVNYDFSTAAKLELQWDDKPEWGHMVSTS